ncbi:DL-methionine transporter subunit [Gammaproteobacteria bacterium]|nr:DL-methionine transporter subunit [Gammaproteobacteria bacterium]
MRHLIIASTLLIALPFTAFAQKLSIAATPVPQAEILEFVKPILAKEGVDLNIMIFNDYVQPNIQVFDKEIDSNFMQHQPYLDEFNLANKTNLVSVAKVHVEPLASYSLKIKSVDELKNGDKIAIPNDVTNGGRALILLHKNGIIELQDPSNILSTVGDIKSNPKNLVILEVEAPTLPKILDEVALALINTNYALDANLNPTKDAIFIESQDSPYANIIVTRPDNKDDANILKLVKALNSPEVKEFIETNYKGALIPAF